jgi:hypothetical protein
MRRIILASLAASLIGITAAASAAPPSQIDVMTQNQYLGADLVPIVAAGAAVPFDPIAFNSAVVHALAVVAANLPEQRYVALAREISGRRPHVVGLQEVFEFSCTPPPPGDTTVGPGNGCLYGPIAGAFNDHLTGTLDALHGSYVAKAIVRNLNTRLPIVTPTGGAYVTVVDRDVILVRKDLDVATTTVVPYYSLCGTPNSLDGCNYQLVATASINGAPLRIERGFVGVDLTVGGEKYRITNTHLEVRDPDPTFAYSSIVQSAQAHELITVTAGVMPPELGRKLIVIGDMNSGPRDQLLPVPPPYDQVLGTTVIVPPYMQFTAPPLAGGGGFTDAWTMRPGTATGQGAPLIGLSCCQLEDLSNRQSMLYERIDMIFPLLKPKMVMDARLIGTTPASKTSPPGQGLWAADHAAVAATLRY